MLAAKKARLLDEARARGEIVVEETVDEWFVRYLPTIEAGANHRGKVGKQYAKWIGPLVGAKVMRTIAGDPRSLSRDDLEDVRDALDRAQDAGELRARTAGNIWSIVTGAMKAASSARDRTLRVHPTPLHFAILPPKRGASRERPWLYPNEWLMLARCRQVPIEWRRTYAVALYSGLRPGELRVLTGSDVDLASEHFSVSKAWDEAESKVKRVKGRRNSTRDAKRMVPIEPNLLPLVKRMMGGPDELLVPLVAREHAVDHFRKHLKLAGVTRARLEADNDSEEPIDFRSLRDSYATWCALAGVPDKRIQRRMGHATASTTDGYIKAAESFDVAAIGAPFPKLPTELLSTGLSIVA
jgi:integrase